MSTPSNVTPPADAVTGTTRPPSGGPVLGLAAAAKACGVSVSTLRRRRDELGELGAVSTPQGWRIPITALIAAGLMPPTTPPLTPDSPVQPLTGGSDAPSDAFREELDELRSRLAVAEQRAAVAEAIAAERERLIESQAMALRMLEVPAMTPPDASPVAAPAASTQSHAAPVKKSFWSRLRG